MLGDGMIQHTIDPGLRTALHQQHLNLEFVVGEALGLASFAIVHTQPLLNACMSPGDAAWDHSGMVRAMAQYPMVEIGHQVDSRPTTLIPDTP